MLQSPLRISFMALTLFALGACSAPVPPEPDEQELELQRAHEAAQAAAQPEPAVATTPPTPAAHCDASQAQGLVGSLAEDEAVEQARIDTGASQVRVLKQGQPVTLEFIGDRLNIEVDENNIVQAVRCG